MLLDEVLEGTDSAKHNSKLLSNTSSNGGGLMTDQMINNGENKISAQTRLQSKGITSKTMLAIKTERLQTKQNGRQYTSQLYYDKTEGFVWIAFIKVYFAQKVSKICTRIKRTSMGNTRDTADHMEEIIQNWETYLGHIKNSKTVDRYIALQWTGADQDVRLFVSSLGRYGSGTEYDIVI